MNRKTGWTRITVSALALCALLTLAGVQQEGEYGAIEQRSCRVGGPSAAGHAD